MNEKKCWVAANVPGAGPCDGRLIRAHLVPQQLLRRELGVEGRRAAEDERSWVWCCGGMTGLGGHHGLIDVRARVHDPLRIERRWLPPAVEEFAAEKDPLCKQPGAISVYLERTYGYQEEMQHG